MLLGWFEEGGTVREIWIKTRKIVGTVFLNYTQVFYTSRGGGSEAPIRRMARWGLLANLHGTSLTLSPAALLPPPSPAALGLIGPSKMDDICRAKTILMTLARSDQT
jgi:hypothetical protein